jgi:molybdenum cofactor cytidylyltransferase
MRIGAVVLAAGASTRMGANKLLLPVEGEPMVHRTVRRAIDAGCDPVVVVTGHDATRVRAALAPVAGLQFAESSDPTGPTSGSLHAGLRALPEDVDAALVMLADMVHITTPMMAALCDGARAARAARATHGSADAAPLAVSRYGDVLAPPLLFHRTLWPELLAWHGEGCGKAVVRAHRDEAQMHDWPVDALQDVDTPEDYEAVR